MTDRLRLLPTGKPGRGVCVLPPPNPDHHSIKPGEGRYVTPTWVLTAGVVLGGLLGGLLIIALMVWAAWRDSHPRRCLRVHEATEYVERQGTLRAETRLVCDEWAP